MKEYFLNIATILFVMCYFPDFYATIKNKNAIINNIPEKLIIVIASSCGLHYSIINNNNALLLNYSSLLILDIISFLLRVNYAYKNYFLHKDKELIMNDDTNNPIHNINEIINEKNEIYEL